MIRELDGDKQSEPVDVLLKQLQDKAGSGSEFVLVHASDLRYLLNQINYFKSWRQQVRGIRDLAKVLLEDYPP